MTPHHSIDLNADLGEHEGDGFAHDAVLLRHVSSASISCGAHAGSADVMQRTIARAAELGVAAGAHPGYPDRDGFGRRETSSSRVEITDEVLAQLRSFSECCHEAGVELAYVKPHGALYNRLCRDEELAELLSDGIYGVFGRSRILTLPGSAFARAAQSSGLVVFREGFIDRAYDATGQLVPRKTPGSLIHDPQAVAERAVAIARYREVTCADGTLVPLEVDSLCVHGDTPDAAAIVSAARLALERDGFTIAPFAA